MYLWGVATWAEVTCQRTCGAVSRDADPTSVDVLAATRAQAASNDAATTSKTIGRFVVDSVLGRGAMGVVVAAHDPDLKRPVAIKLLRAGGAITQAGRDRLLREAQAMARLSHPNVVTVYEVGTHADQVFVVMEQIAGETLRDWLAVPGRTWRQRLQVVVQAGLGVEAAHVEGLVHRDIKPENVLIGRDQRPRVTDFGLVSTGAVAVDEPPSGDARVATSTDLGVSLTATGTVLGTPRYMAPEQHRGESVDARADQFSYAVMVWEAMYGAAPFAGTTYAELRANVLAGRLPPAPTDNDVPAELEQALRRALAVAADDRYPTLRALLDALATHTTHGASAVDEPRSTAGSKRMLAAAGIGTTLVAALVVALVWAPWAQSSQRTTAAPTALPAARKATQNARANKHFKQAEQYIKQKRYNDANREFQLAYAASPTWQALYNIGLTYSNIRNCKEMHFWLGRFRDHPERPDDIDKQVTAALKRCPVNETQPK